MNIELLTEFKLTMEFFVKKILPFLSLLAISSTVFAGSYSFDCTAFHLDKKSNEIYKLNITREGATLDNYPGVLFDIEDPNVNLLDGEQKYVNAKNASTLVAKVRLKSKITSLSGNLGPRENDVDMYSAIISVDTNGSKETFVGSCTEITVSSCGGSCQN